MRCLWIVAVLAVTMAFVGNALAEQAAIRNVVEESAVIAVAPSSLIELDAAVKDDGESIRETRQFRTFGGGFGRPRPFYGGGGGGFGRPRPFYGGGGGGFGRPRPFYGGGGFGRPRPFYGGGGFYRPPPFYGGYYGPRPFYGGGFYG